MTQCACASDAKVVPISRARMSVQGNASAIDAEVLAALKRRLAESDQSSSDQREIELSDDDLKALDSQAFFKSRFGFVLGRRGRAALFDAIDQHDLTDAEVRALNRVGSIQWDGQILRVIANRWIGLRGSLFLTIILVAVGVIDWRLATMPAALWNEAVVLLTALPALLCVAVWIYRLYLMPFRLFGVREIGQQHEGSG